MQVSMDIIARIHTDFPKKFGIPRQSGLVDTVGRIVFEPAYRVAESLRGIEGYSHLWLLWQFSEANGEGGWSPTVRPPRLGGNARMGVFATRSPFRPNAIGLSSVKLLGVEKTEDEGTVLIVGGADLLDGTPIFDIKPYLSYTDSHPEAVGGFSDAVREHALRIDVAPDVINPMSESDFLTVKQLIANDPRPSYQHEPKREYFLSYSRYEITFRVDTEDRAVISDVRVK